MTARVWRHTQSVPHPVNVKFVLKVMFWDFYVVDV